MGADGFGSSVIIAVAAVLWLAYLIPTWLKRREYLATERNALRLQQTLRIMAESAEIPTLIRAEASARSVVQQQRILRAQQQREVAIAEAELAATAREANRALAETRPAIAADVAITSPAARRLRRSRAVTALVLLVSLITVGLGVLQLVSSAGWTLLAGSTVVAIGSVAMLGQMASVGRARGELARTLRNRESVVLQAPFEFEQTVAAARTTWTPVAIPKPLYMTRPAPERALVNSLDAAAELRQAAADAERRLRAALSAPEVTPIRAAASVSVSESASESESARVAARVVPVAPVKTVSGAAVSGAAVSETALSGAAVRVGATPSPTGRFARMGFLDEQQTVQPDIDAVLRRRRSLAS